MIDFAIWRLRCFEVRAALDLQLLAMRKAEDHHQGTSSCDCLHHDCPGYLPVAFDAQPQVTPRALVLTREQLVGHRARPGTITDRLDHPLLCARGIDTAKNFDYATLLDKLLGQDGQPSTLGTSASALNDLSLVLSSASNLNSLALMGILERAVDWFAGSLSNVQRYSVGPSLVATPVRLRAFPGLEELHLCDVDLSVQEADDIVDGLPAVRRLAWAKVTPCSYGDDQLAATFERLAEAPSLAIEARLDSSDVVPRCISKTTSSKLPHLG